MKTKLSALLFAIAAMAGLAQQPAPLIWAVTPQSDDLYKTDTSTWTTPSSIQPAITSSVIAGINGIAYDPTTYKSYIIAKVNSSRYLAEINLATGSCTVMGDLGDSFSSITFDEAGQLYGATGDGATQPESFFKINKATASNTLVFQMGNGDDGEVICFNRFDNNMYHWSGNSSVVYEKWPVTSTTYSPTNISLSGSTGGETFGALNLTATRFILATINGEYQYITSTGAYGWLVSTNPDAFRGVIMPPRFAVSPATVCANGGTVGLYSNCLQLYDSVYYYWGDGNVSQVLGTAAVQAASSHSYAAPGTYTISVMLNNGIVPKSIFTTFTVLVSTSPTVAISGSSTMCPGTTLTLTGTSGGASQWYAGGVAIPNATLSTYTVSAPGLYNMVKTNLNGCADSAAAGHLVVAAAMPTIAVSSGTICNGLSFTLNPSGASTYTITGGSAVVSPTITTNYSVTGTGTSGCSSTVASVATVVVGYQPTVTAASSNPTICVGKSATLTATGGAGYLWVGGQSTNSIVVSPTVTSTYTVSGNGAVACSATTTVTQYVTDCTGLPESLNGSLVKIMPNPTSGVLSISNLSDQALVEVYNQLGQLVISAASYSASMQIDLGGYSPGIYFIRVSEKDKLQAQFRVIRQ